MLPVIRSPNLPLDTSIVFSGKDYNYYNIKCKGFAKFGTITESNIKRSRQSFLTQIKSNQTTSLGSPQKVQPERFLFNIKETNSESNILYTNSDAINSNPKSLSITPSTFLGKKRSLLPFQTPTKSKILWMRKCCNNKNSSKVQNDKNLTTILQQKLFKQIKDDDTEERMRVIKLRGKDKLANYTSSALQEQEKWGTNNKQPIRAFNTFGRHIQRIKKKDKVREHTGDELLRLAFNDIKLYIPSHAQYLRDYTKEMVRELLLQSNTGVKYRSPV